MKPVIGITPLADPERESYWMLPGYMTGIAGASGLPVMLPLTDDPEDLAQSVALCDGFLFAGGHDVSPALYGETPLAACGAPVPLRDRMETALLRAVLQADKPLLGVCRGLQLINAALGGSLYQDLPSQTGTAVEHHQSPPYNRPVHVVRLTPGCPLAELLGRETLAVNSYHHQGIKVLAPGLEAMAAAPDGLVEAFRIPGHAFAWAIQWHPECSYQTDPDAAALFRRFVAACAHQR